VPPPVCCWHCCRALGAVGERERCTQGAGSSSTSARVAASVFMGEHCGVVRRSGVVSGEQAEASRVSDN